MIVIIMDNLVGLVNPNGEIYTGLSRETRIAYVGLFSFMILLLYYLYFLLRLLTTTVLLLYHIFDGYIFRKWT